MFHFVSFPKLTIDKSSDDSNQNSEYDDIDGMTVFHDELSILFQVFTDEREEGVSHTCADDSIDNEFG